jgi:long-chain fatty acid transport protein
MRQAWQCRLLVGALLALAPSLVEAAGFQLRENDAAGLGTAFAGTGSAADTPATVFDNPAGMVQLPGVQVQLGGSIAVPSFVFHGGARDAFGRPIAGADDRNGGNAAFIPHGFVTAAINSRLSVGLALTSPFGLATTYGSGFVGRYQADKTTLQTININPAIAYRVTDWLSIGAGLSAQYAEAGFSNFLNSSTIAAQTFGRPVSLPDGYFRLHGDSWSVGYNAGVLVQPRPGLNLGLAYRSRVQQDFSGTADFVMPAPLNLSNRFRNSGGTAKVVLPDTATLSVTQHFDPQWTAYGELTWTNWSQFKNLNVFRDDGTLISSTPERYHNSFFVAVGASYALSPDLVLRGGLAFDKTPTTDAYRTARVPDQDRYWIAAGLSYRVLARAFLDLGYAHLFVPDSSVHETSSTGDVLTGHYSSSVDLFSLGTRLTF